MHEFKTLFYSNIYMIKNSTTHKRLLILVGTIIVKNAILSKF